MSLTEGIIEFGLDLGYSRVGITTADGFPGYVAELNKRQDMYRWYIDSAFQPIRGADPREVMPSARSIVVLVWDYAREAFPEKLIGKVGRFYQARGYMTPRTRINGARRHLMQEFLEANGCEVAPRLVVPERLAAARAGVTTYGKNTFAFAEDIGSLIMITALVINTELEYGEPTIEVKCPPDCTACIDACPTGALYDTLEIDPRRCIAFNTFITVDGNPGGLTGNILPEIRDRMGTWIHGCDICQEVCPRNQKRLKAKLLQNEFLTRIADDFELTRVLNLTDEYYVKRVQPLMYNYLRDQKYFRRNAAIALGNTGDTAFIPDLALAMEDPEELVRAHVAWALGKIGGSQATQVLETALTREASDSVRQEILSALATA